MIDFPSWYSLLREFSIPSCVVPLNEAFVSYLQEDGIYLPFAALGESELSDDETIEEVSESCQNDHKPTGVWSEEHFKDIHAAIERSIQEWDSVFPKLTWSSPKDASWISWNGTLECRRPEDVYMLLKASDRISCDLHQRATGHYMVLRKWTSINPSTEFRCFVIRNKLVAISQRNISHHYAHLGSKREEIIANLSAFAKRCFFDSGKWNITSSFIFDVTIKANRVVLVDVSEFDASHTSFLLFSPADLEGDLGPCELRLIESETDCRLGILEQNRMPADLVTDGRFDFQQLER